MTKKNRLTTMTNNDIKKTSIDILERSDLPSGAEVIDMKSEDIDKLYIKKQRTQQWEQF